MMNSSRQSDESIVPEKSPNKAGHPAAEEMEGRDEAKGSLPQQNTCRTLSRVRVQTALEQIRKASERNRRTLFTSLFHHVYNCESLRAAYYRLKRDAAPGVDGQTWKEYGSNLVQNLEDLSMRLRTGAYRAKPVRRVFIPKADGSQRPLGVTAIEDKLVQCATVAVLNAVYEPLFAGFSYGFRPGRSQHQALDALNVAITRKKVKWVLDADISKFFDAMKHGCLIRLIERKIGDPRIVRLIQKWLKAGVMEDGSLVESETGSPQGGCISPVLANIYLHHAFDHWAQRWRREEARGDVIIVRYADDTVAGFQYYGDAVRFQVQLQENFRDYGLELHPQKTRTLEFGRYAAQNRAERGEKKPETFTFLGFTHICGKSRAGEFQLKRLTCRKRMARKLHEIKMNLRERMHHRIPEVGRWLASVIRGHNRYFGVPLNYRALRTFHHEVVKLWYRTLKRRSHKSKTTWKRMGRLAETWLPKPQIVHLYPDKRLCVNT